MVLCVVDVIRVDEGSSFLEFSAGIRYPIVKKKTQKADRGRRKVSISSTH